MKNRLIIIFVVCGFFSYAQEEAHLVLKQSLIDLLEDQTSNSGSEQNYYQLGQKIEELLNNPLNINTAEYEDFIDCLIFTDEEINSLLSYRKIYTQFLEIDELQATGAFTEKKLNIIKPLLTITTSEHTYTKFNNHQLLLRTRWKPNIDDFKGSQTGILLKYQYDSHKVGVGITIEQDYGEPFDQTLKKGPFFDFTSGYISLKKSTKNVQQIIVGDYALQSGQGLLYWNSFAMGGSFYNINISRSAPLLLPYKSVNEHNFLRGICTEVTFGNLHLIPFISYKKLNATSTDSTFSTVYEDGLHRTNGELNRKNSTQELQYGLATKWSKRFFAIGGVYSESVYNKTYQPSFAKDTTNKNRHASLDYKLFFKHLSLNGELATRNFNSYATIHNLNIIPAPQIAMHVSYRYYSSNYYSFYENAYKNFTRANNETGIYTGLNYYFNHQWSLMLFADWYKTPETNNTRLFPTRGSKKGVQLQFNEGDHLLIYLRWSTKTTNSYTGRYDDKKYFSVQENKQNLRFDITYAFSEMVKIRSRAEYADYEKGAEDGFLLFQDFYHKINYKFKYNFRIAYFQTTDFDAAIYAYESDVLYAFNTTAYFEKGIKYYLNLGYSIGKHWDFWLRGALTNKPEYFQNRYNKNIKSLWELKFQLRLSY